MGAVQDETPLRDELAACEERASAIKEALTAMSRSRQGVGWLCWPCTEQARTAGTILATEHRYHEAQPCDQRQSEGPRDA